LNYNICLLSISRLFKKEEDNIEEIRQQEKRLNDFKKDMVDELYRSKLRRNQKIEHLKIVDSYPKSNFLLVLLLFYNIFNNYLSYFFRYNS
jgi:hypothetical protein